MDDKSYLIWKLIGGQDCAQGVFEDLVKSALLYHFKGFKKGLFPVDSVINDAIFGLNSQDQVPLPMYSATITGQQLKELFIATIFAKEMQKIKRFEGKTMFLAPPIKDDGADIGIFVVASDGYHTDKDGFIVITKESESAIFQIKEYVDYQHMKNEKMVVPQPLDPKFFHIEKLKVYNEEIILIYIRDSRVFTLPDLQSALQELKGKKVYVLLSFLADISLGNGNLIKLVPNCYNFLIIDVWPGNQGVRHVWFTEPASFKKIATG